MLLSFTSIWITWQSGTINFTIRQRQRFFIFSFHLPFFNSLLHTSLFCTNFSPQNETASWNKQYIDITASSKSTRNKGAVPHFFHDPVEVLTDLAKQILDGVDGVDEYMPATDPTHYLAMEAAVVRASALYLLHPVEIILSFILPPGLFFHWVTQARTADSTWDGRSAVWGARMATFALLEYKYTKVLRWEDFKNAVFRAAGDLPSAQCCHYIQSGSQIFLDMPGYPIFRWGQHVCIWFYARAAIPGSWHLTSGRRRGYPSPCRPKVSSSSLGSIHSNWQIGNEKWYWSLVLRWLPKDHEKLATTLTLAMKRKSVLLLNKSSKEPLPLRENLTDLINNCSNEFTAMPSILYDATNLSTLR